MTILVELAILNLSPGTLSYDTPDGAVSEEGNFVNNFNLYITTARNCSDINYSELFI